MLPHETHDNFFLAIYWSIGKSDTSTVFILIRALRARKGQPDRGLQDLSNGGLGIKIGQISRKLRLSQSVECNFRVPKRGCALIGACALIRMNTVYNVVVCTCSLPPSFHWIQSTKNGVSISMPWSGSTSHCPPVGGLFTVNDTSALPVPRTPHLLPPENYSRKGQV